MSQNYNLNSSFGFNVSSRNAQGSQAHKLSIGANAHDILGTSFDKSESIEKVFNGDVEKEIGMYSRQAMIVGMSLKAVDNNIRRFDFKI